MRKISEIIKAKSDRSSGARTPRSRTRGAERRGDVQLIRSHGLDGVSVSFPAGVDLEERAARMNAFWHALVRLQFKDVVVVAICTTKR
jgi:hypothetical protein